MLRICKYLDKRQNRNIRKSDTEVKVCIIFLIKCILKDKEHVMFMIHVYTRSIS